MFNFFWHIHQNVWPPLCKIFQMPAVLLVHIHTLCIKACLIYLSVCHVISHRPHMDRTSDALDVSFLMIFFLLCCLYLFFHSKIFIQTVKFYKRVSILYCVEHIQTFSHFPWQLLYCLHLQEKYVTHGKCEELYQTHLVEFVKKKRWNSSFPITEQDTLVWQENFSLN